MKTVKTRFAPSPTGYLHVGGLRTALYAYLFAKKNDGVFLLRIEDTDQKRAVKGAAENLMDIMKHFDLNWDEGPYFQSERTELYMKHAKILMENGHAYRCFCTSERLQEMREQQQKDKQPPKYDRRCLNLPDDQKEALYNKGTPFVIRQQIPLETLEFHDLVRGDVSFHGKDVDDQVLIKSDGFPTYHLANVVDDHDMEITHVIRGEEWLPSTPKHVWLYKAFGWELPAFAHLPLLLNPDKTKLSKRQGDVAAEDYINKGYIKAALINFIAFLGWNPGTEEEIFSLAELVNRFSLDRVQKAGAVFNIEKLDWLNGQYLRKYSDIELAQILLPALQKEDWFKTGLYAQLNAEDIAVGTKTEANDLLRYTDSVQTRMQTLKDGPEMLRPFLIDGLDYDIELFSHKKMKIDQAMSIMALENSLPAMEALEDYTDEDVIKQVLVDVIAKLGVKNGQVLWPLRVALTNEQYSPGTFELIRVLGKEKTLTRIRSALAQMS
jgi:glutamyl-tRNA synthetase